MKYGITSRCHHRGSCSLVINNVVLINAKIPSESMENTIMTGDRIFGYRLAYGLNMDVFGHEISKNGKIRNALTL